MDKIQKEETPKQVITDEEREQVARSLDENLDNFINNLKKTPYKDGWKEETWREEMEKHPFFTSKPVNPEDEPSPLIAGLQNLRYDPDDNTAEELAYKYKEDGNFQYRCRKYELANMCYKEGLKLDFPNIELRALILNNLSASHFFMLNFRSSLIAAEEALKLKPDYMKTRMRAIHCCIQLKEFDKCLDYCNKYLEQAPNDIMVSEIKKETIKSKKIMEMEIRKNGMIQNQIKSEQQILLNELNKRQLNIVGKKYGPIKDLAILTPKMPGPVKPVHLVNGRLVWPVIFLYPEYNVSDFIEEFHEDSIFYDHLVKIFSERPDWDVNGRYSADTVNVYSEFFNEHKKLVDVRRIRIHACTLFEALSIWRCPIDNGIPKFTIYVARRTDTEFDD